MRTFQPFVGQGRRTQDSIEILPYDEIIQRKGWGTYRQMLNDPQVSSTLQFKKIMVYGRKWDVQPASDDEADKEVAEFVRKALMRANFKRLLRESLSCLQYGFSVGEKIWELGKMEGEDAILLKDIKFRDPEFMRVMTDKHGNVTRWLQDRASFGSNLNPRSGSQASSIDISPDKVFHYAHNREFSAWYGRSDLRSAYRSWWAKKFLIQFWSVFLERFGQPMTAIKYPMGSGQQLKDDLKKIMAGFSTKTELLIPEGVEISLIEATRAGTASYDDAMAYHDKEIARAMLMVALLGAGGNEVKRGADSQSRLHLRTLHKMADELGADLMFEFNKQVVKQLVDFNFDVEAYPTVYFQDYGEFESFEITDAIRLLHSAGILELDGEDTNFARSLLGLPIRDEDKEDSVVRPPEPPPPGSANQPPPPAQQGNQRAEQGGSQKA
jgi:phage gp29-like protein